MQCSPSTISKTIFPGLLELIFYLAGEQWTGEIREIQGMLDGEKGYRGKSSRGARGAPGAGVTISNRGFKKVLRR